MSKAEPDGLPDNGSKEQDGADPKIEGLDGETGSWDNYPLDELLIRSEVRTIYEANRRIEQKLYVMDPDFQRDFIWDKKKQSKLIESVIMRIPLPVFYLAEDKQGRMVVVDGLQRLSTFTRFLGDQLKLNLPKRQELNGKKFSNLSPKLQNRIEDCNLIFYIIDANVPPRTQQDIFDRVNSGAPLTRQQMRNCLFQGKATHFLREEAQTPIFQEATGGSLKSETMRDREFINRFCAFQLLDLGAYRGDMDEFLETCLRQMNTMEEADLSRLSAQLRSALANNFMLFGKHAFRRHTHEQERRRPINAALWDVMSTGLSRYGADHVQAYAEQLRQAVVVLLADESFQAAITLSTSSTGNVVLRFKEARQTIGKVLDAHTS